MARVNVFLADGFEEIEALTVVDLLRRVAVDVNTVSITNNKHVTGARKIEVVADTTIDDVDFASGEMIVLPGGMPGTKNLEACETLMSQVDDYASSNRYVAAICAAPTILGHRSLLVGKKACCYPGMQGELDGAEVTFDEVTVDDKIITSRGLGTAVAFALKLVEILVDEQAAKELGKTVVYQA